MKLQSRLTSGRYYQNRERTVGPSSGSPRGVVDATGPQQRGLTVAVYAFSSNVQRS